MTDQIQFEAFDKIPRLKRGCVITEKIDGTNAQIYIPEAELRKLGPGRHFGEWCVSLVPVLHNGDFTTEDDGPMLVVFHVASRTLYKATLDGDGHKGVKAA